MNYGTRTRVTTFVAGVATKDIVRISDSIKIARADDIHTVLDELLAKHSRGELFDPSIEVKTDARTGGIDRVVQSWTDPESKLY